MARFALLVWVVALTGCTGAGQGLLVMAHGGDAQWNAEVERIVAALPGQRPTEIALGMADPDTIQAAVKRLESRNVRTIAVVRMFISGDSFLPETEYILGLRSSLPRTAAIESAAADHGGRPTLTEIADRSSLAQWQRAESAADAHAHHAAHAGDNATGPAHDHHMAPPRPIESRARFVLSRDGVADSPLVDEILVDRVRALSRSPADECVLILGHGPGDDAENERWLAKMRLRAQGVHHLGRFRHVQCETLREDWPGRRTEAERRIRRYVEDATRDGARVIVVPFRVAGFGPYADVLAGLDYVADGRGFCPHPNMTQWIESQADACLE